MVEKPSGAVAGGPRLILRVEGLCLLAFATWGFSVSGLAWWLYAVLFFVPDLSFAAYLAGPRAGAFAYNLLHSTIGPAVLALGGVVIAGPSFAGIFLVGIAAVWAAHIGFDRMLGYGLKYGTFHDTHLGRIGRELRTVSA